MDTPRNHPLTSSETPSVHPSSQDDDRYIAATPVDAVEYARYTLDLDFAHKTFVLYVLLCVICCLSCLFFPSDSFVFLLSSVVYTVCLAFASYNVTLVCLGQRPPLFYVKFTLDRFVDPKPPRRPRSSTLFAQSEPDSPVSQEPSPDPCPSGFDSFPLWFFCQGEVESTVTGQPSADLFPDEFSLDWLSSHVSSSSTLFSSYNSGFMEYPDLSVPPVCSNESVFVGPHCGSPLPPPPDPLDVDEIAEPAKAYDDLCEEILSLVHSEFGSLLDDPAVQSLVPFTQPNSLHAQFNFPSIPSLPSSFADSIIELMSDAVIRRLDRLWQSVDSGDDALALLRKCVASPAARKVVILGAYLITLIRGKDHVASAALLLILMQSTVESDRELVVVSSLGLVSFVARVATQSKSSPPPSRLVAQSMEVAGFAALANLVFSVIGHKGSAEDLILGWSERWRAVHGAAKQIELLSGMIVEAINWAFVRCGFEPVFTSPVIEWETKVSKFYRSADQVVVLSKAQLLALRDEGNLLVAYGAALRLTSPTLVETLSHINLRIRDVLSNERASPIRIEPVVLVLHGPPATGKSTAYGSISSALKMPVFVWNPNDEFWQGYTDNSLMVFDDPLAVSSVEKSDNFLSVFHSLAGSSRVPLNMADLGSKGQVNFNSTCIVVTTNLKIRNGRVAAGEGLKANVGDFEALNRRFHIVAQMIKPDTVFLEKYVPLTSRRPEIQALNRRAKELEGSEISLSTLIHLLGACIQAKKLVFDDISSVAASMSTVPSDLASFIAGVEPPDDGGSGVEPPSTRLFAHMDPESPASAPARDGVSGIRTPMPSPSSPYVPKRPDSSPPPRRPRQESEMSPASSPPPLPPRNSAGRLETSCVMSAVHPESEDAEFCELCWNYHPRNAPLDNAHLEVKAICISMSYADYMNVLGFFQALTPPPTCITDDSAQLIRIYRPSSLTMHCTAQHALKKFVHPNRPDITHHGFVPAAPSPPALIGPMPWTAQGFDWQGQCVDIFSVGPNNNRCCAINQDHKFVDLFTLMSYSVCRSSPVRFRDRLSMWMTRARGNVEEFFGGIGVVRATAVVLTVAVVVGVSAIVAASQSSTGDGGDDADDPPPAAQSFQARTPNFKRFMKGATPQKTASARKVFGQKLEAQSGPERGATLYKNVVMCRRQGRFRQISVYALVLRGDRRGLLAVMPSHFFGGLMEDNDVDIAGKNLIIERVVDGKCFEIPMESCTLSFDTDHDCVVAFVPNGALGEFKDITSSLLSEAECLALGSDFTAWRLLPQGRVYAMSGGSLLDSVTYEDESNDLTFKVSNVVRFKAPGSFGQCGLPYWLDDGRILGFHSAGNLRNVVCPLITREFIRDAFLEAQSEQDVGPIFDYVGFDMPHCPRTTKLRPSKLWEVLEGKTITYGKNKEKSFDFETPLLPALRPGRHKETKPAVLERLRKVTLPMQDPLLDDVFYDWMDESYDAGDHIGIVDFADCFRTYKGLNNFDLTTSPCVPYVYLGEPGKTGVVTLEGRKVGFENRVIDLERQLVALGPVQETNREVSLLAQIAREMPLQGTYKDETLKPAKITRPVVTLPLEFNVLLKMYFGRFFAHVVDVDGPIAIGINPYSDDWRKLYEQVFIEGAQVSGDDVQAHQSTILLEDLVVLADYLNRFDPIEEHHMVRKRLLILLGICSIMIDGEVVSRRGQNPSGQFLTSLVDSIQTMRMECYTLIKLLRQKIPNLTAGNVTSLRRRFLFERVYGDDSIRRVSGDLAQLDWSQKAAIFAELGVVVTNSTKTGPPGPEEWSVVRFLSRGFVHDGATLNAPLDAHILADMLAWDHGRQPHDTMMLVKSALREAAEMPPSFYVQYEKMVIDALYQTERLVVEPLEQSERKKMDVLYYDSSDWRNSFVAQGVDTTKFDRNWEYLHGYPFDHTWKRWSFAVEKLQAQSGVDEKEAPTDPSVAINEDPAAGPLSVEESQLTQIISSAGHPIYTFYERTFAGGQGVVGEPTDDLSTIFKRRYQVDQVAWSGTDSPLDILSSGSVLESLIAQQSFASRNVGFSAISWDSLDITVMGIASQGHYGTIGLIVLPEYSGVAPRIERLEGFKALYANGMVNIAPAVNSTTTIRLPWCSSTPSIPLDITTNWSQVAAGAMWRLVVVTPLRYGASDSTPAVTLSVYIELNGVRLHRPKLVPSTTIVQRSGARKLYAQSEANAKERLGMAEKSVRDSMGRLNLGNGPIRKIVGGALRGALDSFMDKPTSDSTPTRVIPGANADRVTMDGVSMALPLTDKWGQKVQRSHADLGSKVDDMLFVNYVGRPESLGVLNVASTDTVGKLLWSHDLDIALPTTADYLGPLQVMGSMFRWWRGTLRYGFYSPSTTFKNVRLRIVYFPGDYATLTLPSTVNLADLADAPSMIIEIKGETIAHVDVPFDHFMPFLRTQVPAEPISAASLGKIAIYVEAPLVSTDSTADSVIPVAIFRCGLSDFEVAVPHFPRAGSFYYNFTDWEESTMAARKKKRESGTMRAQSFCAMQLCTFSPNPIYAANPSTDWSHQLFGRTVRSFKELLKRYHGLQGIDLSLPATPISLPFNAGLLAPTAEAFDLNLPFWRIMALFSRFSGGLRLRFQNYNASTYPVYYTLNEFDGGAFSSNGSYVVDPEVRTFALEQAIDVPTPWWSLFAIEPYLSRAINGAIPTLVVDSTDGYLDVGIAVADDFVAAGIVTTSLFYDPNTPSASLVRPPRE